MVYREIKLKELPDLLLQHRYHDGSCHAVDRCQFGHELDHDDGEHSARTVSAALLGLSDKSDADPANDQRSAALCRDVHGHDTGGSDLHADLLTGGRATRHAPGAFRNHDDCQSVHWSVHAAGWHLPVYRMRRR